MRPPVSAAQLGVAVTVTVVFAMMVPSVPRAGALHAEGVRKIVTISTGAAELDKLDKLPAVADVMLVVMLACPEYGVM